MVNHLQSESSPYLLQHARNPVNWYPWSTVALTRARVEDKPIFLSIGYSACHWCHVMEHESFEDATIADFLNEHFVCIKVDREERPDLDQIYMTAVQQITGRGGWPMSVFLTPELQPFYGGTYFPPHARHGMPGFDQVLTAVVDAWKNRRQSALEQARQLTDRISQLNQFPVSDTTLSLGLLDGAMMYLQRAFDREYGGFGPAPKFPHALDLQVLLRLWQRTDNPALLQMVTHTLDKMAVGGIYDQLGGGFARYSVDERWLVPHFEKMLYDNALLAAAYVESYLATGNTDHARVARETLDYVLRQMTDQRGAFYSAEDADSEGEEGKYYVWTPAEIAGVLGPDLARRFCRVYDVTAAGNFEGHNILNLPHSVATVAEREGWPLEELQVALAFARSQLLAARQRRVPPGKDDKVIVSWNGLMIDSLSRAARALGEPRYLQAARAAAEFIHDQLWRDGRLLHCWRAGSAKLPAYLDDYTTLANALVSLYEASLEARWLQWAFELMDQVMVRFNDDQGGALFYTADDHERLVARVKDLQDSSTPSGNAMAALALLRLAHLGGRDDFRALAERILLAAGPVLEQAPGAAGQLLIALDLYHGPVHEIAFVGSATDAAAQTALQDLGTRFLPRTVLAHWDPQRPGLADDALRGLFQHRPGSEGQPTFYVCHGSSCWEPARGAEEALRAWDQLERAAKTER